MSSGGQLLVGQSLATFAVGSNIVTSNGGKLQVAGNLGTLTVGGGITESTGGAIAILTDVTGPLSVAGAVSLSGGTLSVGRDLSGAVAIAGNLALSNGGQFTVGRNLGATTSGAADTVTGSLMVDSGSTLSVGGNVSALTVGGNLEASGSGKISVAGNLTTLTVNGGGGGSVTGNVTLSSGGQLLVGQNVTMLVVGSNLQTSGGGKVSVGGDLATLTVTGVIVGDGNNDIAVGDDLGQLTVLGGGASTFGVTNAQINAGDSIQGVDIRNGITKSLLAAGVLINGGTLGTGSNGWNIGPNAIAAVFDSQILAGSTIENIIIGGNVQSDMPTNSGGQPTRIIAGEYPQNTYVPGGTITNFQIFGNLIDSVIAASVKPYNGFYPQPSGTIVEGTPSNPVTVPNYTAPPFADSSVPVNQIVLAGGSINASFAPAPSAPPGMNSPLPLPSKPTVLGTVITSTHVFPADYAGIFASNTTGVIVGPVP